MKTRSGKNSKLESNVNRCRPTATIFYKTTAILAIVSTIPILLPVTLPAALLSLYVATRLEETARPLPSPLPAPKSIAELINS